MKCDTLLPLNKDYTIFINSSISRGSNLDKVGPLEAPLVNEELQPGIGVRFLYATRETSVYLDVADRVDTE